MEFCRYLGLLALLIRRTNALLEYKYANKQLLFRFCVDSRRRCLQSLPVSNESILRLTFQWHHVADAGDDVDENAADAVGDATRRSDDLAVDNSAASHLRRRQIIRRSICLVYRLGRLSETPRGKRYITGSCEQRCRSFHPSRDIGDHSAAFLSCRELVFIGLFRR